uniref:Uncharacterized protein n=1 Tax=Megaselia scalaris TaxID=36166 RepID=T1GUM4_MEGSC
MSNKLNPDVWKQFDKGGKSEFVKFIKLSSKDSDHFLLNKNGGFNSVQIKAIHELIWQFLNKNVRKETILQVFSEIATTTSDASSAILDVLNNVDCETSVNTDAMQDERLLFLQLLKDLSKVIPENLIKERLEIDTLQDAGIVKNRLFYSKFIKIKTKL